MKRFFAFITVLVLILNLFSAALSDEAQKTREVLYFYENYCESCSPEEDFKAYFRSLTGVSIDECDYRAYNTVKTSGQKALDEAVERYGLVRTGMPMVIVDGIAYYGASEMEEALPSDALTWGESVDSVIVLLTVPFCESCVRAAKVLETLPETVVLKRGNLEIESAVITQIIDISSESTLCDQLFKTYGVPEENRIAPTVFYADTYLSGADAIEKRLYAEVMLGWAAGGIQLAAKEVMTEEITPEE